MPRLMEVEALFQQNNYERSLSPDGWLFDIYVRLGQRAMERTLVISPQGVIGTGGTHREHTMRKYSLGADIQ